MLFLLANCAFLILVLGYSWWVGSPLDRLGVSAIIGALLLTLLANRMAGFPASGRIVLAIDFLLFLAMTAIAVRSPRHWPVWFAGLQLASVLFGIAALLWPVQNQGIYRTLAGFFAIPAMLAMALGLFLDRLAGLERLRRPGQS